MRIAERLTGLLSLGLLALLAMPAAAGVRLVERPGQTTATRAAVEIDGTVRTHGSGGKTDEHKLVAKARFGFLETRLDKDTAAGKLTDPSQLKAVRNYLEADLQTDVSGHESTVALPDDARRIVVVGRSEGPIKFSPTALLMRESVDLLDMPGDPFALVALLPDPEKEYEAGDTWTPPEWVGQMLCSIDAIAKVDLTCTLKSIDGGRAVIEVKGRVEGARLGAYSKINLAGVLALDLAQELIVSASFNYSESAEIGTITPGVLSTTSVRLARQPASQPVDSSDVPLTVPPEALSLYFDAGPWGVRMQHGRDWHIYFAQLETDPKVVILRRLDGGNLQCQCNLASIPPAAPGQHTPVEQFEADIRRTLGARFGEITSREQYPGTSGVKIFRTDVAGQFAPPADGSQPKPINWTYYLIAAPDGRQLSAIFAHEPGASLKLGDEDLEIVRSLEFFPVGMAKSGTAASR